MPNGPEKKLNFIYKVLDPVSKTYKPVYIAPDATNVVQGDVKLSDATNSALNAATGMTAATPAAIKAVKDDAVSKSVDGSQTIHSSLVINGSVNAQDGLIGKLSPGGKINVKSGSQTAGSATFNGVDAVTITIPQLDATTLKGLVPLGCLPQGALERLVKVQNQAARFALTTNDVQLGDTVQQLDTGIMYVVIDQTKLNSAAGYQEYTAGTATQVPWGGVTNKVYASKTADGILSSATFTKIDNLFSGTGGTITANVTGNLKGDVTGNVKGNVTGNVTGDVNGDVTGNLNGNVTGNVTGDVTGNVSGNAGTATKLKTSRTIALSKDVTGSASFDGSANATISSTIAAGAVNLSKLNGEVSTLYVGETEPTDNHIKFWIEPE